jgi:hypothetical protein
MGRISRKGLALLSVAAVGLAMAVTGVLQAHAAGIAGDVFVSPTGDDRNPGSQAAPVRTLQRAQALVRGLDKNMTADVTVVLADGFYRLTSPLALSSADSGTGGHNVVWTADSNARPVLAGSIQVIGWQQMSVGSPIWVAQAPSSLRTRQLYVNGSRAGRAHGALPASLTGQNSTGYSGGATTMAGWRNPSGAKPRLEFVYRGGLGAWTEPRCPVASISSAGAVTMTQPCWNNSTNRACCFTDGRAYNLVGRKGITEQPTQVENAFQFLSASTPGQWFLDQGDGKVYYVPRAGENMATADVEAPVLETLLSGNGVHNVVFNGIQFSYATWLGSNSGDGFAEIQANYQVTGSDGAASQGLCHVPPPSYTLGRCPFGAWTQIPGNVSFTNDQNVQFTNDAFVHLGAAGLTLGDGSQHDLVKGDIFTDISGSGLQVGNVDQPTATGTAQTRNNTISDNHVFNLPAEYHGGIGIDSGYTASDTINHNQIDHTAYSAISQGWGGWPDKEQEAPQPNFTHDNVIANNLIFNHMSLLNDGGGIYTQGITGTSLSNGEHVTGNLIHDQTGKGHVIYTDNGCTFESILGNGVYNTGAANGWGSTHHDFAPGATTTLDPTDVENNFIQNPPSTTTGSGVTVANNTTITSGSQVPSSIVDNAGLESAFKGLLNWTQAPLPPVGRPDFALGAAPSSATVAAGGSTTFSVQTAVLAGNPGPVTLSASGLPAGAKATFSPNPVTPGATSTMTVTTAASDPGEPASITVTGTGSGATHAAGVTLTVTKGGGGGVVLSNLVVGDSANAASWSLRTNLQVGDILNGDRTYPVASLPAALVGAAWVRTANSSKTSTADPLVTFTVSQSATVFVGVDTRSGKRPWMDSTWVDTGTQLTTNESGTTRTYEVFQKGFAAGQVALGPNGANTNMYTIAVV